MSRPGFHASRPRRHAGGFGLIELMIALVLGLLVIGAAFAVFQSNQATYRANEGVNRIQESIRVAFEIMSRDIRAASGSSCSRYANVPEGVTGEALNFRDTPVTGNATSLTVRSGDDMAYQVDSSTSNSVTLKATPEFTSADQAFDEDDWLVLCNARMLQLVQATAVSGMTVEFTPSIVWSPTNDPHVSPATAVLARYRSHTWFVQANDRGSSLYVSRSGGAPEEVAEGVQSVQFAYLQRGAASYATTPGNDVVAIRVTLTLTGQDVDGAPLVRTASNVINLRSRTI